jgi:sugar (pentulose or hexulose) kinase
MLAAGMKPGDLLLCAGATNRLSALVEQPIADARRMTHLLGVGGSHVHVTYNPAGGDALGWMHGLCFRDQTMEQFRTQTIEEALGRTTRVTLDPPHLGGDPLEIEAHRAAFRGLTLSSDRMDLLAALLQEMRRQHRKAIEALGVGDSFRRIVVAGESADLMKRLLPDCAAAESLEDGSLRGVAHLFRVP